MFNVPVSCQKKNQLMFPLRNSLSQKIKIKGMYTASLSQPFKPVEPQRGYHNAATAVVCVPLRLLSLFLFSFLNMKQAFIRPAVYPFGVFFSSAVFIPTSFTHTHLSLVQLSSVWFSAGSQWDLFYVQQPTRGRSHLKKCQIVCVFPVLSGRQTH